MNSSRSISPGCNGGIFRIAFLVVVNDFDFIGIAIPPLKADSPLIVNANTPLTFTISVKLFQMVSQRLRQLFDSAYILDLSKFPKGNSFDRCKSAAMKTLRYAFCFFIGERPNHRFSVTRLTHREKEGI